MCVCQTITFESLDVGSLYSHICCIFRECKSDSYMVIWSLSQEQKVWQWIFLQCKTLIGHNSASVKHRALRFACSVGFSDMADRMVWLPSLSHDQKWPHVTKCTHLQVVSLWYEGSLVTSSYAIERDRTAGWVSYGQKWKTGTGRQYLQTL